MIKITGMDKSRCYSTWPIEGPGIFMEDPDINFRLVACAQYCILND